MHIEEHTNTQQKSFRDYLNDCEKINGLFTRDYKKMLEQKEIFDVLSSTRPVAVDILIEHECNFFAALGELIEKHKTLETVEQIEKLTKDILKLCK